jgi:hypothetical protein
MPQVVSDSGRAPQRGDLRRAQLDHAQDPAFVRALEQHRAEIDRMLARSTL